MKEKTLLQKFEQKAKDYILPVSIDFCSEFWLVRFGNEWVVKGKTLQETLEKFVKGKK